MQTRPPVRLVRGEAAGRSASVPPRRLSARSRRNEHQAGPAGTDGRFRSRFGLPQPAEVVQHRVQARPGNELHHVIMLFVLPADAEDRHDVGMVELGRGLGLALEAADPLGVDQAPAERTLTATRRPSDSCSAS